MIFAYVLVITVLDLATREKKTLLPGLSRQQDNRVI